MKRQSLLQARKPALLQVASMARVPASVKRTIYAFLATDSEVMQDPLSVSAPQAHAYEFQSGGVVEMLGKLEDKFKDERNQLEKEEMKVKFAHETIVNDLENSITG